MTDEYVLVAGRSNPELAQQIADYLKKNNRPYDHVLDCGGCCSSCGCDNSEHDHNNDGIRMV